MLHAAQKRFMLRNIPVQAVVATTARPIPQFPRQYELILAIEVIEHVFNPFELLTAINAACTANGVIVLGSFPFTPTNAFGDHLQSAVDCREEIMEWISTHWQRITLNAGGNVFQKH